MTLGGPTTPKPRRNNPETKSDRYNSIADRLAATDSPHQMLLLEAIAALRQAAQDAKRMSGTKKGTK
ncbi:hypothetical protein SAMN07250955_10645 [Arboricoccus pini]|uniref:Uncharacterized protein n=1 Tax=Arboricoccus pini TaxID=1963835 RepID=A0A212R6F4_9PROT|nr:hypothetical protein [Arboricoccus pini]SNB67771.1 hypothetical protein SAMN07250955_10645 [Arboricoccus pini]